MKTLSHNSQIRVKGFEFRNKITVGTIAGYAKQYGEDPEAAIARAKDRGDSLAPWTNQAPGVLVADYPGKAEDMAKDLAAFNAAPEIENGELVEIEGEIFTVRVLGERYSDPVAFIPAK